MAEKILVVDDDLDTLRLVGMLLQRQGYEIVHANNGHQALAMAQSEKPDLILLDVMMPDMDGIEVTRRLRVNAGTREIPIIMFTAKTQVEDKIQGFEAGADDYLTKPTQPRELFAHIKAVLGRTSKLSTTSLKPEVGRGFVSGVLAVRGGLGVTTLALNLGISLYDKTRDNVIIADFRPGFGAVGIELGYLRQEGLSRLLHRKPAEVDAKAVEAELISHPSGVRLLLASSQPKDARLLAEVAGFEAVARQLPLLARHTVIDLGAALPPQIERLLPLLDKIIIVLEPVAQTVDQSKVLLEDLKGAGVGEGRIETVLVNRVRSGLQMSWTQAQDQLGRAITAVFTPAPELAFQASARNLPMVLHQADSLTAQQFAKLADRVLARAVGTGNLTP
jgi:pilus assembly protein CpaE